MVEFCTQDNIARAQRTYKMKDPEQIDVVNLIDLVIFGDKLISRLLFDLLIDLFD